MPKATRFAGGRIRNCYRWRFAEGMTNKNVPWLFEQLSQLSDLEDVIVVAFGEGVVPVPVRFECAVYRWHSRSTDLARLFAAADVFVSASLMETYGFTLVEAMACGIPVVAFRVGGIPEAAPDGQGGILCAPHDGAALVEAAITKLAAIARQLRKSLGIAKQVRCTRNATEFLSAVVCRNLSRMRFRA